jgi:hypothetical protein
MGSESNDNHSDNLRSSISGIINLRTLVFWSCRPLVLLLCQLVVELPVVALPSCPLVISSRRHLFSPHLSSSSHCTALSSYHCSGWLLLRRLSLRRTLVLFSTSHCATLSSSNRTGWLLPRLSSCRPLIFSLRRTLVLLSSSHCTALSPSHHAVWLLHCLSLICRLDLSSSSYCSTILSTCADWLLCCLSSHRPLVLLSCCSLILLLSAG